MILTTDPALWTSWLYWLWSAAWEVWRNYSGWVIGGGIFLFLFFLLNRSIVADIEYPDKRGDFSANVRYLFIRLYSTKTQARKKAKAERRAEKRKRLNKPDKPKKPKKQGAIKAKAAKIAKESGLEDFAADVKKANSSSFDFEMIRLMYDSAKDPVKRLIRKTGISGLRITCIAGGRDAAKTAIAYGLQSAAISTFLAWFRAIVRLKIKSVKVSADWGKEKTELYLKCRVKLKVCSALWCLLGYLVNTAKNDKTNTKATKAKTKKKAGK